MLREITVKEYIDMIQNKVNEQDMNKPLRGIGYISDGFYTIHIDDGFVQRIVRIPTHKERGKNNEH